MLYKRFAIDEMVNLINVYFIYYKKKSARGENIY